jgi:hypothetical protein
MHIYFLVNFFLPIAERPTRPEPIKSMAVGSGKVLMMTSMFMKPARAFPAINNKPQITKRNIAINFFIDSISFLPQPDYLI